MHMLFVYLLLRHNHKFVSKEELMVNIWEGNNLIPSTQRLWQVINNLNKKLELLGLPANFIHNVKGRGYSIRYDEITPLYYRVSEAPHSL
ncbi:Transcriptional regulatory protein, C terminal [Cedecea lapagei]|uniref:Transcriptional regulatory protein, C terminal n=2 Tax=Cedecea lapagei TaxID=158823 RepID=A0A3S4J639_9ENTR|nr:Transcriptional regulatory protein, C terminal [Cedecea lapagei]